MTEIDELKKTFASRNLSDITQKRWLYIAEDFLQYLKDKNKTIKTADEKTIRDYLAAKNRVLSGNSMKTLYYILKSFFWIWRRRELFDELKEDVPRDIEPERPYFTVEETRKLMEVAKRRYIHREDFFGLRDLAMVMISADTGTRRIQIQRLDRNNFTPDKKLKIMPARKGGTWTVRKLRSETVLFLEKYLVERGQKLDLFADKPEYPLFIDKSGKRISPEAMGWAFLQIKKDAGIIKPGAAFHGLRRSKTTRLARGGASLIEIVKALGWAENSKEPHIYAQLDQSEVQEKANKADELFDDEG
jgi:integrase